MNIHTQITTLALLCALPLSNSFAAQPAQPNSLEAKLAAIDALPDHEILSMVVPRSQELAEQWLMNKKDELKQDPFPAASQVPKKETKACRLAHKYWVTRKELESCNDHAQKQYLQAQRDGFGAQLVAASKEAQEAQDSLIVNQTMPISAYNYQIRRSTVYHFHASLLLAQKEKLQQKEMQWQQEKEKLQQEKDQWQQEKDQLQQREQSLLAQLKGYQLFEDGQQIEGMPHAPGGVPFKKEHKRRGSF